MKIYGRRYLLNNPGHHGVGAIVAELHNAGGWWQSTFQISDCSRVINISFCDPATCSDDEFYNDMEKLYRMKNAINEFEKGLRRVRRQSGR